MSTIFHSIILMATQHTVDYCPIICLNWIETDLVNKPIMAWTIVSLNITWINQFKICLWLRYLISDPLVNYWKVNLTHSNHMTSDSMWPPTIYKKWKFSMHEFRAYGKIRMSSIIFWVKNFKGYHIIAWNNVVFSTIYPSNIFVIFKSIS